MKPRQGYWLAAAAIVIAQLVQAKPFADRSDFLLSYWAVDYRDGFVRRGFGGQLLGLWPGAVTEHQARVAMFLASCLGLAAVLYVVVLLLRRGTTRAGVTALLLVASPFSVDYIALQQRSDQVALVPLVLAAAGALWLEGQRRTLAFVAAGALFVPVVLSHEAVVLYGVAPCVLTVDVLSRRRGRAVRERLVTSAVIAAPSGLAALVLAAIGQPSAAEVAHLLRTTAIPLQGTTMFTFLADTFGDSFNGVMDLPNREKVLSIGAGIGLAALHIVVWMRIRARATADRPDALQLGLAAGTAIGAVLVFLVGFDWLRWFAALGLPAMIGGAFLLLQNERADDLQLRTVEKVVLIAVGVYLAALSPLPATLRGVGGATKLLLFR